MKLRHKRTGEIIEIGAVEDIKNNLEYQKSVAGSFADDPEPQKPTKIFDCKTVAELNDEWEDYEEPKEYWYIDCNGDIEYDRDYGIPYEEDLRAIGNYFKTQEEAERALEKLKAWKRLRNHGCKILGHRGILEDSEHIFNIYIGIAFDKYNDYQKDLDLLFGGEE